MTRKLFNNNADAIYVRVLYDEFIGKCSAEHSFSTHGAAMDYYLFLKLFVKEVQMKINQVLVQRARQSLMQFEKI